MNDWPLRWKDGFEGQMLDPGRWVGGRLNSSREVAIRVDEGLHIAFEQGREYAAAGIVTRDPLLGDFDARVRFTVETPQLGTTFELAAIGIDVVNGQNRFTFDSVQLTAGIELLAVDESRDQGTG